MKTLLTEEYGIQLPDGKYSFASTNKQVYLISPLYNHIKDHIFVEKIGVPIYRRHNDTELHPLHGLGNML